MPEGETMANDNTTVSFKVTDNGTTKKLLTDAKALGTAYDKAGEGMAKAAKYNANATRTQLQSQAMTSNERLSYGVARSAVGTGAEGRDFAKQAQGLGGLVHLYATFAANLFAVSAAFTALRNAADTTNMIKGLDQLGASSGRNLGGLAKQLVEVTDGAISLREAMTATAQATSAGMSGANLQRLAIGAKNASQALGIGMPDALSRLSRGITKLEPELLDEIGVFVRVDDAAAKYARSLGKTTSSLTDFEKRTAFATEVLGQLETKFGTIDMAANPYDKLAASLANVSQKGLEFINKILGPLITSLAESPMALSTALAGIAAVLVKQAIPAIGMYRENARRMADEAHNRVLKVVADQQEAAGLLDGIEGDRARRRFELEKTTQDKIMQLQKARFNQDIVGKDIRTTLKKSTFDLTEADKEALNARAAALLASDDAAYKKQGEKLRAHMVDINAIHAAGNQAYDDAVAKRQKADDGYFSHQKQLTMQKERLDAAAAKRTVLLNASETAAVLGPIQAFRQLNAETNKLENVGVVARSFTKLQGAFAITTAAAVTALNAFGPWLAVIALVGAGLSALDSYLSGTGKESAETTKAIEGLESEVKNLDRTLEVLSKKPLLENLSIDSINARANALTGLAGAVDRVASAGLKELTKQTDYDRAKDMLAKFTGEMFSKSTATEIGSSLAEGILNSLKAMESGPQKKEAEERLKKILKVDKLDMPSLQNMLGDDPREAESIAKKLLPQISKALEEVSQKAQVAAAKGTELRDSFKTTGQLFKDLSNSFIANDPMSKLGMGMIETADKLKTALNDPTQSLNAMKEAIKDVNTLNLFPPETAQELLSYRTEIQRISDVLSINSRSQEDVNKTLTDLGSRAKAAKEDLDRLQAAGDTTGVTSKLSELGEITNQIRFIKDNRNLSVEVIADLKAKQGEIKTVFDNAVLAQMKQGADIVASKIAAEWGKASASITGAVASLLGDSVAGIKLKAQADRQQISAQMQAIRTQIDLITSNKKLAIELELLRIAEQRKNVVPGSEQERNLDLEQAGLEYSKTFLDPKMVKKGTTKSIAADIANQVLGAKETLAYVQQVEGSLAQIAALAGQNVAIAIREQADTVSALAKNEKKAIEDKKLSITLKQEELALIEQYGYKLSEQQEDQKLELENAKLIQESRQKILDIDTQLTIYRQALSKMTDPASKAALQVDITRLETTEKTNVNAQLMANINKNNLGLEEKRLQKQIQLRDATRETADVLANIALSTKTTVLDNEIARLETAEKLGLIYETEYISLKKSTDLRKEALGLEAKTLALKQANAAATAKIEDDIKKAAGDEATKKVLQAQLAASNAKLTADLANENTLYNARVDGINKLADYAVQNTQLMNGLTDAIVTSITEGGQAGAQAAKAALVEEFKKPISIVVRAIISPIVTAMQSAFGGLFSDLAKEIVGGFAGAWSSVAGAIIGAISGIGGGNTMNTLGSIADLVSKGSTAFDKFTNVSTGFFENMMPSMSTNNPYSAVYTNEMDKASDIAAGVGGQARMSSVPGMMGNLATRATAGFTGFQLGKAIGGDYKLGKTSASTTSAIGSVIGSFLGPIGGVVGGAIGGLLNRMFGTKTSVTGAGIEGTFSGEGFSGRQFKDVFRKGGWFRRNKSWTEYSGMDQGLQDSLGMAFKGVKNSTADLADSLNISTDGIKNYSKSIRLNLAGMDEAAKKAALSKVMEDMQEDMAKLALGTTAYNREGETSIQALTRLSTSLKTANKAFDMLGQGLIDVSLQGALVAQGFIDAFGGAEKMSSAVGAYMEAFYTADEQRAATVRALSSEFEKLDLVLPNTREAFRQLVDSAKEAGDTEAYAALINLAPTFASVSEALLETGTAAVKVSNDIVSAIMELTASSEEYKKIQRETELTGIDPSLRALKRYQYALQDVKEAQDLVNKAKQEEVNKLKEQQNVIKTGITTLKGFISSFVDLKKSLLFDQGLSPLSVGQKYSQAKADFSSLLAAATSTGTSESETAARRAALEDLSGSAKKLLETSREANASSEAYMSDYQAVQSALDAAISSAGVQLSVDEQTLAGINTQIDLLSGINTGIMDLNTATQKLVEAQTAAAIYKASSTSLMSTEDIKTNANAVFAELNAKNKKAPTYVELASTLYDKYKIDPQQFMSVITADMYGALRDTGQAFASGGLATGLSLVGENGPEMVDFRTPGRVYTAEQTQGMFNGVSQFGAVVAELRSLREEVCALRAQQTAETGHLITATYDSQNRNAEDLSKVITESTDKAAWSQKVKNSVVIN